MNPFPHTPFEISIVQGFQIPEQLKKYLFIF